MAKSLSFTLFDFFSGPSVFSLSLLRFEIHYWDRSLFYIEIQNKRITFMDICFFNLVHL